MKTLILIAILFAATCGLYTQQQTIEQQQQALITEQQHNADLRNELLDTKERMGRLYKVIRNRNNALALWSEWQTLQAGTAIKANLTGAQFEDAWHNNRFVSAGNNKWNRRFVKLLEKGWSTDQQWAMAQWAALDQCQRMVDKLEFK